MAKKKKEKEKTLLNKFSRRVYGLLLIAAGWLLLAAVCFYSPADSSFNLAADNIRNLFGYPGASAAAVILTFSGLALPLFVIPVMVWGYRLCLLEDIRLFWLHFIVWLLGIAAAMMCFDFVRFAMPLGGVIGRMLNIRLFAVVPEFPFRRETVAAVASLVMLAAFSYTVDVTAGQWRRGIKNAAVLVWRGIRLTGRMLAALPPLVKRMIPAPKAAKPAGRAKKERREPKVRDEKEDTSPTAGAPVEKAAAVKAQTVKTAGKSAKSDDGYRYPDVSLLTAPKVKSAGTAMSEKDLQKIAQDLENVLQEFGINGKSSRSVPVRWLPSMNWNRRPVPKRRG